MRPSVQRMSIGAAIEPAAHEHSTHLTHLCCHYSGNGVTIPDHIKPVSPAIVALHSGLVLVQQAPAQGMEKQSALAPGRAGQGEAGLM